MPDPSQSAPSHHPTAPSKTTTLRLRVSPAAESAIRSGHPWLYADSVRDQNREGSTGDLAVIFDRCDRFLAFGLFDLDSPLRVRILHNGKPATVNAGFWSAKLALACEKRASLFGSDTDGYRLVNGESDGWPALVIDRYASAFVLKLYSAGWLGSLSKKGVNSSAKPLPDLCISSLLEELSSRIAGFCADEFRVILRFSRNIKTAAANCGFLDGQNLLGRQDSPSVIFQETGLRFESEVVQGQKTGFFLDQRDNRRRIEGFAAGADVLNVFSFSGGFSVYAARGGARSVTDLDISSHALAAARRNLDLNKNHPAVSAARHVSIQADAFEWLESGPAQTFDIVVLDPPSLAKRESERPGAIRAYERLAIAGIRRLRRGGLLLCASCSAHVGESEFFEAVRRAARASARRFSEIQTAGHAPDHAASFPEAVYLKAIYLRLET